MAAFVPFDRDALMSHVNAHPALQEGNVQELATTLNAISVANPYVFLCWTDGIGAIRARSAEPSSGLEYRVASLLFLRNNMLLYLAVERACELAGIKIPHVVQQTLLEVEAAVKASDAGVLAAAPEILPLIELAAESVSKHIEGSDNLELMKSTLSRSMQTTFQLFEAQAAKNAAAS